MLTITKKQAKKFIQAQQGLLGTFEYEGEEGILALLQSAGCIQYDPIDICGTNTQLILFARVKNAAKNDLYPLLYEKRQLIDQMDKMMSIYPAEDWPFFKRNRLSRIPWMQRGQGIEPFLDKVMVHIQNTGPVSSKDLPLSGRKVDWHGGETAAEKAALETLYHRGEVLVHHKVGANKYYDVAHRVLPPELILKNDPFKNEEDYHSWRMKRRIGAVGLLWNKASDAWLNIDGLTAQKREAALEALLKKGEVKELAIEGLTMNFYYLAQREALLIKQIDEPDEGKERIVFLPPLDQMLWDRKLIKALYDFDYTWELYTPAVKRKYGPYTLPVLKGTDFIGRIQMKVDKNRLIIQNYWPEAGRRMGIKNRELNRAVKNFALFHGCDDIFWEG